MDNGSASAFYRKWRSQSFADLVGQDAISRTLRNAVRTNRVAHAYLFCGPRGVGKTSAARILAKAINCPNVADGEPCAACASCRAIQEGQAIDVIELDAASNNGVDQIRDLRDRVGLAPASSRFKVYILDEAHMLSASASNALLKTMEEPPPHAVFVLVTTDAQKLPDTIVSRCQRLDFRRISGPDTVARLAYVCKEEGITPEPGVLELLARGSAGSLRDAEGALDQVVAYAGAQPTLALARSVLGVAGPDAARELLVMIQSGEAEGAIRFVNRLVDEGADPRQIALDVVDTLRNLLLLRTSDTLADMVDESAEARTALKKLAVATTASKIVDLIRVFTPAPASRAGFRPQLPLEIAVIESLGNSRQPAASTAAAAPASTSPGATTMLRPAPPLVTSAPPSTAQRVVSTSPAPISPPTAELADPIPVAITQSDPTGAGAILFENARHRWNEVLDACGGRNRSVQALLRSARLVEAAGDLLVLGFTYPFHRERIEDVKNRAVVEDALERVLGQKVRVQCKLLSREAAAATDPMQAVMDDPVVRAAVALGARVRSVLDDRPEEKL